MDPSQVTRLVARKIRLPCALVETVAWLRLTHRNVIFLDSASPEPADIARHSIIAWDPFLIIEASAQDTRLIHADGRVASRAGDPLEWLRNSLTRHTFYGPPPVPFTGGAIGWLGYEFGAGLAGVRPAIHRADAAETPGMVFGIYAQCIVHDHLSRTTWLIAPDEKISSLAANLGASRTPAVPALSPVSLPANASIPPRAEWARADYLDAVRRIRDYIAAGDVYQVNLAHRFTSPRPGDAFALYQKLRAQNPAPFSAYVDLAGIEVLSSSPERFLRLTGRQIETRPIKGTRRRLHDSIADAAQQADLLASEKDRAELLMIIDLERNDLGRICETGSVQVDTLRRLETYATVHHLVSTVSGRLKSGLDVADCLRAMFPGGSITGAPKLRAMQIIAELEPLPRGPYTGAMGWIGFNGDADLNIAIRTIVCAGDRASYHVGSGITWNSDPESEYQETLDKGRALHAAFTGKSRNSDDS